MIRWLLSWLFPLWALLPRARRLGAVSFTEVSGVGWQATIRPSPANDNHRRDRRVNCWSAQARTIGGALREVINEATTKTVDHGGDLYAPRLGGKEFDDE
jgi:hypothetical protein